MDNTIFLLWIALSVTFGFVGKDRKIGFWWALILSLLFSPLIGGIVTLTSPRKKDQIDMREFSQPKDRPALAIALQELQELRMANAITEDEYQTARKNILGI